MSLIRGMRLWDPFISADTERAAKCRLKTKETNTCKHYGHFRWQCVRSVVWDT